jgi:hypothetical protein
VGPAQTGSARLSAPGGGPVQLAELVAALSLAAGGAPSTGPA